MQDWQLLKEYTQDGSQAAFASLVERNVNFVYSICLREVRDPALAEDVAQVVFLLLAKKAHTIREGTVISGWLFNTARFASKDALRREMRRVKREHKAANDMLDERRSNQAGWDDIEPLLDDALATLSAAERHAVLLRFFDGKSLRETGEALGLTENAAGKRVSRAVEKLRRYFNQHGFALPALVIIGLITQNAVHAAPASCVTTAMQIGWGVAPGSVTTEFVSAKVLTTLQGTMKSMFVAQLKSALGASIALTLIAGSGGSFLHLSAAQGQTPQAAPVMQAQHAFIKQASWRGSQPIPTHHNHAAPQPTLISQHHQVSFDTKIYATSKLSPLPHLQSISLTQGDGVTQVDTKPSATTTDNGHQPAIVSPLQADAPLKSRPKLQLQIGHAGDVNVLAYTPDGKVLATGADDNSIKLWDVKTGELIRTLNGHTGGIKALAFSPDGAVLASGSWDKTAKLWDAATGNLLQTLPQANYVTSLAFAPTGHTLAVANWDQQVRLWDVTDATAAEPLLSLVNHAYSVEAVAFSPDGKWLATGGWDKSIKLLETKNFKVVRTLTGPASAVTALAFSADSQTLVSGSGDGDGTVKLWDVNTGEVLHTYNTPLTMPRLEQPDGRSQIASGYTPSTARVWSVAIAPDNQTVACSQGYPGIKVWNAATGAIVKYAGGNGPGTGQIAFSPDGSTLAGGEGSSVNIWDTKNWKLSHYLAGTIMMRAIAYSPDGDTLATGSWDQTIRLWDTHTGDLKKVLQGHTGEVHYLAFSPDGKLLASGSADHTIKLWDTQTWKLARPLNDGKQDNFAALAFSPDSKLLACADSVSHKIQFWDVATNKKLSEAPTMNHQPTISLAFSPDGKTLAEGTSNGFVFIRDVDKALRGEEQSLLEGRAGYTGGISSVAFFPAEVPGRKKLLAVSSFENSGDIRIYSLGENGEHRLHGGQAEAIESLAFAPDGSTLATIGQSGLHLWDTQKSTQLWSSAPGQFAGKPLGIAFAPDGGQIVTCGMDGMVRLWAVERGPSLRLTGTLFTVSTYINAPSTYLKVTPDGYFGGSKDAEHYIRWQTGSQLWPAEKFSAQFNRPDLVQQTFAGQRIPAMGTG